MSKVLGEPAVQVALADEVSTEAKEDAALPTSYGANPNPSKDRSLWAWFDKNDGPEERKLILKLDFLLLSYACMGFWVG